MSTITHAAIVGPKVELTDYQADHVIADGSIPTAKIANLSGTNTGDQTLSDATITTTDVTTNNVSTSKHGFAPKAPNDATKFLDGTGAYSTPSSSGGLAHSYVGYNTIGASHEALSASVGVWLLKKFTVASSTLILSVSAYLLPQGTDHVFGFQAAVFGDTAGAPGPLLSMGATPPSINFLPYPATSTNGTNAWYAFPTGAVYVAAGDYWIGFGTQGNDANCHIAFDTSGTDQTYSTGGQLWVGAGGYYTLSSTTKKYSIRGDVLS